MQTTQNTTPEIPTTQNTTPEKATTQTTTPKTTSTQNTAQNEYRHIIVLEQLPWAEARAHCMNELQGDLIQYDNRILTIEGRRELQEILGIEAGPWFHTGIRRDPDDITTWRRAGDGKAVELSPDGWSESCP